MLRFAMSIMIFSISVVSLLSVVAADLLITYPAGGETLSGLKDYTVTWIESNIVPLMSDLDSYAIYLYAGTNDNYTEMASTSPSTFAEPNTLSNIMSLDVDIGPNSNNNAYFIGITSTLKANNSIQIINFSNRFSMADMSLTLKFDPPIQNSGISPPTTREFACGPQVCPSETAIAGFNLATPTAPAVTSIPASVYKLGASSGSDEGTFSFSVVTATLGAAGGLFTIFCLAIFILFRGKGDRIGNIAMKWRKQGSVNWWNKPLPKFATSEQFAETPQYETAELPCEEKSLVFELAAGSIRSTASRKGNQMHELSRSSSEGEDTDHGFQVIAPQYANTIRPSEILEARETTTLLSTHSSSHSRTKSMAEPPPPYMPPSRQPPALPTV